MRRIPLVCALLAPVCLAAAPALLRAEAREPEAAVEAADAVAREDAPGQAADAGAALAAAETPAAATAAAGPAEVAAAAAPATGAEALAHELALRLLRIAQREQELELRERSVGEIELESQRILDEIGALRGAVDARIAEIAKGDVERIARLAKVYAAMPPASAAKLLEALPLDVSARVLSKMKQKHAAQILAVISDPKAVSISKNVLDPLQLGSQPAAHEPPGPAQ